MKGDGRAAAARLALASVAALAALYAFATGTSVGRDLDDQILNDVLEPTLAGDVADVFVDAVNQITFGLAVVALVGFAVTRRGRGTALLAVAVLGANLSTAALKVSLRDIDPLSAERARDLGAGFYPSGHVTAMMSVVLAAVVLAAPGRPRARAALLGGLAAGAVGAANVLALDYHASDVVGGLLMATAWVAGAHAIGPQPRCEHRSSPRGALVAAVLAAALGGLAAAAASASDHPAALFVGAGGVCAIALLLAAAVAALGPRPD